MMSEQTPVLLRMRDVGMALEVADMHGQLLNRIQLQKFIYLVDVIDPLYGILPPRVAHLTYKHGPYDSAIQNAVDALAFRGLASIRDIRLSLEGTVSAEYEMSVAGRSWLGKLIGETAITARWSAALAVGEKIDALGWNRLVDLVYAEPTFVSARPHGYGQRLIPNDGLGNTASFLMALMNYALEHGFGDKPPNQTLIVELFFRYLDEYDRTQTTWAIGQSSPVTK